MSRYFPKIIISFLIILSFSIKMAAQCGLPPPPGINYFSRCSGDNLNLAINSDYNNTWNGFTNPNVTGITTAETVSDLIDDVLINTTDILQFASYRIISTDPVDGCVVANAGWVIFLRPDPAVDQTKNISEEDNFISGSNTDGITTFDLNSYNHLFMDSSSFYANELDVTYYATVADANNLQNPLPQLYENTTPFTQTIHARVEENSSLDNPGSVNIGNGDGACTVAIPVILTVTATTTTIANPAIDLNECDDLTPDGFTFFNLTQNDAVVTGAQDPSDLSILYYINEADAMNQSNDISMPENYMNTTVTNQTIWVRVDNLVLDINEIDSFELTVLENPTPNNPTPLETCDTDNDGIAEFVLSDSDDEILNGDMNSSIQYFSTESEALMGNPAFSLDATSYTNIDPFNQTVYARVENTNGCFVVVSLDLVVLNSPEPNPMPNDYPLCDLDGDGIEIFDLTSQNTEILNGLDLASFSVQWYSDEANAENEISDIPDPMNYASTGGIVYARVTDEVQSPTTRCFVIVSQELLVLSGVIAGDPSDLESCDDDASGSNTDTISAFDLTIQTNIINNGDTSLEVFYYSSQADLDANIQIANSTNYNNIENPQTIFALVENSGGCSDQTTFNLVVNPNPSPVTIDPVTSCDENDDGMATFDLTAAAAEISNGEANVTVTFHETLVDAETDQNAINSSSYISGNATIFARDTNNTTACFTIVEVELEVNNSIASSPLNLNECDDNNDEIQVFDLTVNDDDVTGSQNPSDLTITYYASLGDLNNSNPISTPAEYSNTTNPQDIYVQVENSATACINNSDFQIQVNDCTMDADGDGISNDDEDLNNNGNLDDDDTDGDMIPNYQDEDDDGDTVLTKDEIEGIGAGRSAFIDTDTDTVENYLDNDDDGDGILTKDEDYNGNGNPIDDDTNNNGIPDFLDEDVALGVDRFENLKVQLYPNPAKDVVHISSSYAFAKMFLYSINGQLIRTIDIGSQRDFSVDISQLDSGMYFLNLDRKKTLKIIKL